MNMQKQGGGGASMHFPLSTFERMSGASQAARGDVWFQNLISRYWFYEDFLWDAFDADEHPLALYDQSTTGTPTQGLVADGTGGQFQIKLTNNSQDEMAGIYMANNLYIQGNLPFIWIARLKVVHAMAANQQLVFGLGSDVGDTTLDNMTRNLWFRLDGDTDLLIEADDNTTNQDDLDTGINLSADTFYWFGIERGIGGRIFMRVAEGDGENLQTFEFDSPKFGGSIPSFGANNLQPVILARKSTGTTTPEIIVDAMGFCGMRA